MLGLDPEKHCENVTIVDPGQEHHQEIEQLRDDVHHVDHPEEAPPVKKFTFKPTSGADMRNYSDAADVPAKFFCRFRVILRLECTHLPKNVSFFNQKKYFSNY